MRCLVKAVSQSDIVTWLRPPGQRRFRALTNLEMAEIFPGQEEARVAIATMPKAFAQYGIRFSIVETDRQMAD
jgi:hypothetical protein